MKDHKQLANQMDLFHFDTVAPGMVFWQPRGWVLFRNLEQKIRDVYQAAGFNEVRTPKFLKRELWECSGHWQKFAEAIFVGGGLTDSVMINAGQVPEVSADYVLKPMSCPAHIKMYQRGVHSFRHLPWRIFEMGEVHRNEPSGALNGCLRLRQFTQDDGHVFCTWEQVTEEVIQFIQRAQLLYQIFGYHDLNIKLSTQPVKSLGSLEQWHKAENLLADACEKMAIAYSYQKGEGAFYGPKLELCLMDSAGREWQCGTIQLDFNLPDKFELNYRDDDQTLKRPVMLHQALLGSFERWIAILLENYQGMLPLWLAPIQVALICVDNRAKPYAATVLNDLQQNHIRVDSDLSHQSLAKKIKQFSLKKVPCLLIIGIEEATQHKVVIRRLQHKDEIRVNLDELYKYIT